jgi:hypothetical protein
VISYLKMNPFAFVKNDSSLGLGIQKSSSRNIQSGSPPTSR